MLWVTGLDLSCTGFSLSRRNPLSREEVGYVNIKMLYCDKVRTEINTKWAEPEQGQEGRPNSGHSLLSQRS